MKACAGVLVQRNFFFFSFVGSCVCFLDTWYIYTHIIKSHLPVPYIDSYHLIPYVHTYSSMVQTARARQPGLITRAGLHAMSTRLYHTWYQAPGPVRILQRSKSLEPKCHSTPDPRTDGCAKAVCNTALCMPGSYIPVGNTML